MHHKILVFASIVWGLFSWEISRNLPQLIPVQICDNCLCLGLDYLTMLTSCISQKAEDFADKSIKSKSFAMFGNLWIDLGVIGVAQ
jgi:hypothetical protein